MAAAGGVSGREVVEEGRPAVVGESFLAYEGGLGTTSAEREGTATPLAINETVFMIHTSGDDRLETGGALWHAGHALAKHILENPTEVEGRVVVDIGAGVGLVGMAAAAAGAHAVFLTDLAEQVHEPNASSSMAAG